MQQELDTTTHEPGPGVPGEALIGERAEKRLHLGIVTEQWDRLRASEVAFLLESKVAVIGALVVIFWILVAVLAPIVSPYAPNDIVGRINQAPSGAFVMGTDELGRDVLSRLIFGSRPILLLAPLSVICAQVVGVTLGLFSGYWGGLIDELIMRVVDAFMAFPTLLLYMIIIAALGPSRLNVVLAITVAGTPGVARIVRSLVLDIRSREYIQAAQLRGESPFYIMFIEILPNCFGPLIVDACLRVGYAAFAIGTLGFLGLGLPPPDPDWGRMVAEGRVWMMTAPWIVLPPSLAITSLVVALNLVADGLQEQLGRYR
jgi:peptide/nickel transport system permease protein